MSARLGPILMLVLLAVAAGTEAAQLSARVDREAVRLDESFRFIIEVEGDIDGVPDFSPLNKDFEIRNQSETQNIQIIHGQFSRLHQWTLTLIPRRAGDLTIPPISLGGTSTRGLLVRVSERAAVGDGATGGPIFLEAEATPSTAYVQSQVIYRLRLYRAVETRIGRLEDPSLTAGEALVERLDEDRGYETRRNGRRYTVIERRYLVTPQRSGTLVFAPLTAEAIIVDSISAGGRYQRVRAPEVRIDVRPVPAEWGDKPWLPALNMTLSESWSENPSTMIAGDPVSYSTTLEADGLVAELLPALVRDLPKELKQYPDRPQTENRDTGDSVSGRRVDRVVLMPASAGTYTLPPVRLAWWNTREHREETVELPARTLQVQPAPADTAALQPPAVAPEPGRTALIWPLTSAALAAGWLVTLGLWWWYARSRTSSKATPHATRSARPTLQAVRRACRDNDAQAAGRALLQWGRDRWSRDPPANLVVLAGRCGGPAGAAIEELDQYLYGNGPQHWEGSTLESALRELPASSMSRSAKNGVLLPLTPTDYDLAGAKVPPNV